MRKLYALLTIALLSLSTLAAQQPNEARQAMLERARKLELNTPYVPPPGEAIEHYASGYAKIMCSSVFVTGLEPDFARENVGYFVAPYAERARLGTPQIDRQQRSVTVTMPNGTTRVAKQVGSQGCVTLPIGKSDVFFKPSIVKSGLAAANTVPWPMGDLPQPGSADASVDAAKVKAAVDAAFDPDGMTAAFVVTHKGRIIGERYGDGITQTTPLESWSMGKSLSGTLMGILIKQGAYELWQRAPVPEWQQTPGDPRAAIRIGDILRMSSGLRIRAPQDPDYDQSGPYPDHLYYYTGSVDSFKYAATRPQQWPPDTVGRYRNTDPVLINYLIRLAVERRKEDYHAFPTRALFDKIGIRSMVLDTDPYGNFLTQGYEQGSARDWARLANLYLQDGVWNGERLLPEGYVDFARTVAPAWAADKRLVYGGGLFWVNGESSFPAPKDAIYMSGVGGQSVLIVPSHQLAVVRLGHYKGSQAGGRALRKAVGILMEAVPAAR